MRFFVALLAVTACSGSSHSVEDDVRAPESSVRPSTDLTFSVRCFDYASDRPICFGTPGTDNWAVAWPDCTIASYATDPELEPVGSPVVASCEGLPGAPDSLEGWHGVTCFRHVTSRFVECFGKLGDYWFEIFADCIWANMSRTTYTGDPAEISCGAASAERGGWDELRCYDLAGSPAAPVCYGRRGAYWVGPTLLAHYANGLFATCELGEGAVEVSPDRTICP